MRFISADLLFTLVPASSASSTPPVSLAFSPSSASSASRTDDERDLAHPSASAGIATPSPEVLENGTVVLQDDGTVVEILHYRPDRGDLEYYQGAICPGFINAHTHLELSYLKGLIAEGTGLVDFILSVQAHRSAPAEVILSAMQSALHNMETGGIVGFGDISNTNDSFAIKSSSSLCSHTFIESFGFLPARAEDVFMRAKALKAEALELGLSASITPHAPYSVSEALFSLIRGYEPGPISIHNQESAAENILFERGSGEFTRLYSTLKMDISWFKPSGISSLRAIFPWLGTQKKVFIHNTFTQAADRVTADRPNTYWCFCPLANRYIEGVLPDFKGWNGIKTRLLLGTDSLASNHQLNMLEEMKAIKVAWPELSLAELLAMACRNGAEFFNWSELGTLEKGKRPGLVHIDGIGQGGTLLPGARARRIG